MDKVIAKKFNISTAKGLKSAELFKHKLENMFNNVHVRIIGTDLILIEGFDN